jgi:hypothetical protein
MYMDNSPSCGPARQNVRVTRVSVKKTRSPVKTAPLGDFGALLDAIARLVTPPNRPPMSRDQLLTKLLAKTLTQ